MKNEEALKKALTFGLVLDHLNKKIDIVDSLLRRIKVLGYLVTNEVNPDVRCAYYNEFSLLKISIEDNLHTISISVNDKNFRELNGCNPHLTEQIIMACKNRRAILNEFQIALDINHRAYYLPNGLHLHPSFSLLSHLHRVNTTHYQYPNISPNVTITIK